MNPILEFIRTLTYSGLEKFGRYYSVYRGFVVNREDPGFYGRLQLNIPIIHGPSYSTYWAWPKHNFSGNGYGSQVIPQKGDVVWVEFEYGNPRKPIWSFGHFGRDSQSKELEKPKELQDYNNYWFKTPGGHLIQIDETNNTIKVTHNDGLTFLIDKKQVFFGNPNNSSEPSVLGNKTQEALENLIDKLGELNNALTTQLSSDLIAANAAGFTGYAALLTTTEALNLQLQEIKTTFPHIKSEVINLT